MNMIMHDGWKYIILAFLDVEGNYFTVLAYRYTTIVSTKSRETEHQPFHKSEFQDTFRPFCTGSKCQRCNLDVEIDNADIALALALSTAHKFLGYSNGGHNLLHLPPRPLPPHTNNRHPHLHRRRRHPFRQRPHHARIQLRRRHRREPTERRPLRPCRRHLLRPQQRSRRIFGVKEAAL